MKTKKMFAMFAAAAMMLTTSCSNDETFEKFDQLGNEAQVTFSLGLENAMNTRAISDGSGINQLYYAVFEGDILKKENTDQPLDDFKLSLVKGKEYTVVFWAWDSDCKAYTVDNGIVTIDYSKIANNYEDSDAFFKKATFTVTGDESISIVLKRAFAQLNVGVSTQEWNNAVAQGTTITKSAVTIKQAATTLNLMNGTVGGAKDITLNAGALPTEKLSVDTDLNGEKEEYTYLSMCYFLVNDESDGASKTTLNGLNFTFTTKENQTIELGQGLSSVPVQRNHRTNILSIAGNGALITGDVEVKVTLDPLYDGEHTETSSNVWEDYLGIYTEEALAGKTIEIPAGWHIRNGYIIEPMPEYWNAESTPLYDKPYTIDGKGNTVTFEPYDYKFTAKNAFAAADGQEVIVRNLTFAGEHFGVFGGVYGGVKGRINYNTLFENVNIVGNGNYYYNTNCVIPMTIFAGAANTTLKNCKITDTYWVGSKKDKHPAGVNAIEQVYKEYEGIYDVFVPNSAHTKIESSTIGRIYVQGHGNLTIDDGTTVKELVGDSYSTGMGKGTITIKKGATVTELSILQLGDNNNANYNFKLTIEDEANIGTLKINWKEGDKLVKNRISIAESAKIGEILANGKKVQSLDEIE